MPGTGTDLTTLDIPARGSAHSVLSLSFALPSSYVTFSMRATFLASAPPTLLFARHFLIPSPGFDTFCPVSDFIPADQIKDPQNLRLWIKIDGQVKQDGNTNDMM